MKGERNIMAGICGLALMLAGCSGGNAPPGITATGPAGADSAGTVPAAANSQSERMTSEAASDLGFLRFAFTTPVMGKTPERVPKDLDAAALSIKLVDERIFERVKKGDYVIHWDAPLNSPVVAYEKDAPAKGGWVLKGNGITEKMTADQLKQLLGPGGG